MFKECTINGKKIEYRKWKVIDKKNLDKAISTIDKRKVIVYDCLKEPVPLDLDEFNCVLALIRDYSLHSDVSFDLECSECNEQFTYSKPVSEIVTFKEADYSSIDNIELGSVQNIELYEEKINNTLTNMERYLTDFAMHIKRINGSDVSYEEAIDYIENLDVDIFEKIITEWDKKKSKCLYEKEIICPKCGKSTLYNLENMPEFFPNSWKL